MADEAGIDTMPRIDRRLHRKQAQHAIGAAADLLGALLAPGPDRRADVVHGAQAGLLQALLHAEIEVRRVDADDHRRRRLRADARRSALRSRSRRGRWLNTSLKPNSDSSWMSYQDSNPCACMRAPPMPTKRASGIALAQRDDEVGAELVAGVFAGEDGDQRRAVASRAWQSLSGGEQEREPDYWPRYAQDAQRASARSL